MANELRGSRGETLFEDDATVTDNSMFATPEVPRYPALDTFGRFQILGRLARGGMAEIYLAREEGYADSERHVVLKRVLAEYEERPEFRSMFLEEGQLATRLYHPNICHVYECGEAEGRTFMTLEWVHGVTLRKVIQRASRTRGVPPLLAAHTIAQVASALEYVHSARGVDGRALNIIHRDVTPHNVMCGWDGRIKLLDFGIAKTSATPETEKGIQGKYAYLAPEQVRGEAIDARSDIFSLGICLFEALAGRPLYQRDSPPAALRAIVEDPPPTLAEVAPEVPAALDAIVQRALQKRPEDRYASAGAMQHALETFIEDAGHLVTAKSVSRFLDRIFDEDDRAPLSSKSAKLTGTFTSLTGTSGGFSPLAGSNDVEVALQPMPGAPSSCPPSGTSESSRVPPAARASSRSPRLPPAPAAPRRASSLRLPPPPPPPRRSVSASSSLPPPPPRRSTAPLGSPRDEAKTDEFAPRTTPAPRDADSPSGVEPLSGPPFEPVVKKLPPRSRLPWLVFCAALLIAVGLATGGALVYFLH